jgi:hypothetical protein
MKYSCLSCDELDTDELRIVGYHLRENPLHLIKKAEVTYPPWKGKLGE